MPIHSYRDRDTEYVANGERSRRLPSDIQSTARRKLRMLAAANRPDDLRHPPGNRFEELKGDRKGTYSLRINDQWRITFAWVDGGPENVCIEDYHR